VTQPIDRSKVNDLTVIATEAAVGEPMPGKGPLTISTVERVMLEDESTVFRCKAKPETCAYVADNIKSVIAHQKAHSAKTEAKKIAAALADVEAKQAAEFARRSAGMITANDEKRERYAKEVTSSDPAVQRIQRKMSDLAVGIQKLGAVLHDMSQVVREMNAQLEPIKTGHVDAEVVEKAKKYDALKGLMKD
jgi:hypothetical protein